MDEVVTPLNPTRALWSIPILTGTLWPVQTAHAQGMPLTVSVAASYGARTGGPFSADSDVSVGRLHVNLDFGVASGDGWWLEYVLGLQPLVVVFDNPLGPARFEEGEWHFEASQRGRGYGGGIEPLAFRLALGSESAALYTGFSGGLLIFDKPIPASNADRVNVTIDVELGGRIGLKGGLQGFAAYRFNHISSASGPINPGIDSHMVQLGLRFQIQT